MKKHSPLFLFFLFLTFFSCKNENELVPVQIPEPEEVVIPKFAKPDSFKASGKPFKLYNLPFKFDSIPNPLGGKNLEFHYGTIYLNYTNQFNKLVTQKGLESNTAAQICRQVSPDEPSLRRNSGGFYNHTLFFEQLTPKTTTKPSEKLQNAITANFTSFDNFIMLLSKKANETFGSQWVWVIVKNKELQIVTTNEENNPLMQDATTTGRPIIAIDVWEHSYLNDYKIQKKEYLKALIEHLNWEIISLRYEDVTQ